jgi:hypothetical protein
MIADKHEQLKVVKHSFLTSLCFVHPIELNHSMIFASATAELVYFLAPSSRFLF